MRKIGNIVGNVVCIVGFIVLLWFAISWVEVISKNLTPNPQYFDWNMFVLLTEWVK